TDGSDPQTSSTRHVYTVPIVINDTTTLSYVAVDPSGNWSPIQSEKYTILHVVYVQDASYYSNGSLNDQIQSILDNAAPGSTIIFLGTHYENLHLVINKELNLVANGTSISSNSLFAVFLINGSHASGTKISGFTIINTGSDPGILVKNTSNVTISNVQVSSTSGSAILVNGSSNITIKNSSLTNSVTGVNVSGSDNTEITGSTITGNTGRGVGIYNSTDITVDNSSIKGNGSDASTNDEGGVYVYNSNGVKIVNNQINGNFEGVSTRDVLNFTLNNNIIADNVADGIYLSGYAENITITNNTIQRDCDGIRIDYTDGKNVVIQCNTITGITDTGKQIPHYSGGYVNTGDAITFGGNYGTNASDITAIDRSLSIKHNVLYN
ncbi:MAG: right-handed parallel beta-helix repeat-containing protein, partial [Methanobacterium paludis]|nr:right-handed parallel beta-helix repeat-containing protein [Methanobacterium paludis]